MIAAAALALLFAVGAVGPPDLLEQARSAFARGEYERAEALALEAATPSRAGPALYLAGLARFRSGRPAQALEALDRSSSADAPAPGEWHYNRAACLHELGRHREAEAEYVAAAELDPALSAVALASAGFAALDGGAPDRARVLADRARATASGKAADLVADLDADLSAAGRAREPDPAARPQVRGSAWQGLLRLTGGWDSDALQSGLVSPNEFPGTAARSTPSALTSTDLRVAALPRLGADLRGRVEYAFTQLAYVEPAARDRSTQQHGLSAGLELALRDDLRLGTAAEGTVAFTGLSEFRGLQAAAGGHLWAELDESRRTSTRLDLAYARKLGLASEFDYLGGDRLEAAIAQEFRLSPLTLGGGYRFVLDQIGTSQQEVPLVAGDATCANGCTVFVDPFAYTGNTAWLSARVRPISWLELELSGGAEWRDYLSDTLVASLPAEGSASEVFRRRRHDMRWFTGAGITLRLSRSVGLVLRHDLVVNRSDIQEGSAEDGRGRGSESENRSYDRHVFTLGTAFAW